MDIDTINKLLLLEPKFSEVKALSYIDTDSFIFEERVKQKCFHCKNYGVKWTCPPKTPAVDYPKMFSEYENAVIVTIELSLSDKDFEEQRNNSTNTLHRALLYLESEMYKRNNSLALSFIGGSCKLCKNGCPKDRCANPYLSRMPWEATGCNIIKTLSNIGINVEFPLTDKIYRYGLFLW